MFSLEGWRLPCRLNVFHGGLGIKKQFLINIIGVFPGVKVYILVIKTLYSDSELDPHCSKMLDPDFTLKPMHIHNTIRMNDVLCSMLAILSAIWIPFPSLHLTVMLN